jgi:hypothetical protein
VQLEEINHPYQVICEGPDDIAFFSRLLRHDRVSWFQVGCGKCNGQCAGKDGFWRRLEAIKNTATVPVKGVVIVADCDTDPIDRFDNVCKQFRDQNFLAPKKPYQIVVDKDGLKTAVVMVPGEGRNGGLESLILDCCGGANHGVPCIDDFFQCAHIPDPYIDPDKLKLRALIATQNQKDPSLAIGYWLAEKTRPFEMNHPAIQPIADFFRQLYR